MRVPGFDDLGKETKEVLSGKKSGIFQYDQKLSVNLKAAKGVAVTTKVTRLPGSLATDVKGSWTNGPLTVDVSPMLPKAAVKLTHPVFDGLKVSISDELPNPQAKGKATADYTQPHLTAKATMSLNSSPLLDASVATGYDGFVAAVRGVVDVPRMALSTWELKAAYLGPNFVVGGHATQNLEKITGTYWQLLDPKTSVAVEVQHQAKDNSIGLLMGYSHVDLEGHLTKFKMASTGEVHILREVSVRSDTTIGMSMMVNALDLAQEPRLGFALDHSP
eukprot:jgi/Ulvmu1/2472/UM136_0024.1